MGRVHVVELGDHVARLAYAHGHADVGSVWDHADNAALREQRLDAGVLAVGDEVFVPDAPTRTFEGLELDRTHELVVELAVTNIRFQAVYTNERPVVDESIRLGFDGAVHTLDLDGEGRTEFEIGPFTRTIDL